jgi:8-oxo-dGTP pyrophosphatase MutT (NUDIX family)
MSGKKRIRPNLYTFSVSGKVGDETYAEAMRREMKEEIGVSTPFEELFKFFKEDSVVRAFRTVFVARSDDGIIIDGEEVESVKWVGLGELKNDLELNSDSYSPSFVEGIKIYFERFMK